MDNPSLYFLDEVGIREPGFRERGYLEYFSRCRPLEVKSNFEAGIMQCRIKMDAHSAIDTFFGSYGPVQVIKVEGFR